MVTTLFNDDLIALLNSAEFKADVLEHRRKNNIPDAGFSTHAEYMSFCNNLTPAQNKSFHNPKIEKKYKWPTRLSYFLYYYIGTGNAEFEEQSVIVTASPIAEDISDRYVTVYVHRDANPEDLEKAWAEIKILKKKIGGKAVNQPRRSSKRDLRLLDLIYEGKTQEQAWKIINKEFPNNKISEYSHISVILGRLRKRLTNIT